MAGRYGLNEQAPARSVLRKLLLPIRVCDRESTSRMFIWLLLEKGSESAGDAGNDAVESCTHAAAAIRVPSYRSRDENASVALTMSDPCPSLRGL